MAASRLGSSFRDPSGFVFTRDGEIYRQVNPAYAREFGVFVESGLSSSLMKSELLVPYEVASLTYALTNDAIALLKPERIGFISYPYEWCFSQLKDAALLTLYIQMQALDHGMTLKDASAYNVQFRNGKPVFIDTLSFDIYQEGEPWIAYKQFCQHFLAPLALMSFTDVQLSRLLREFIDGIPLELASKLLPRKTRFNFGLMLHLHGHARAQSRTSGEGSASKGPGMSKTALKGLIASLQTTVEKLRYEPAGTEWADYYNETNYSDSARKRKEQLVQEFVSAIVPRPLSLWDLGANTGEYSRFASAAGISTIAWDIDPAAVEKAYLTAKRDKLSSLLPLVQDLSNPSPRLGWAHRERESLEDRGPAGALMALALVHHLAIGNNVPLLDVAAFFASIAPWAIVEFVPKEDTQTQKLLKARKDVFSDYTEQGFEAAFCEYFDIVKAERIDGTQRKLYLLRELKR